MWEYKNETFEIELSPDYKIKDKLIEKFNEFGSENWEVITTESSQNKESTKIGGKTIPFNISTTFSVNLKRKVSIASLPDIYAGELNTERIKQHHKILTEYKLEVETIAHIFDRGADFYKTLLRNTKTSKEYLPDIYAGELNTKRIKTYNIIASQYNIENTSVASIFDHGADYYKSLLRN